MELRTATLPELRAVYETLLIPAFPPAELKPLRAITDMVDDGCYDPLVLTDGGEIAGVCFLWLGVPGWALLDYLCVSPARRGGGDGAEMLRLMEERYAGWTVLGEVEEPASAPEPALARRRLGFYARNRARPAGYDTEAFGVRYNTIYWAGETVPDEDLILQHRFIYESRFGPERFAKYMRIPLPDGAEPRPAIPWEQ